MCRNIKTLFNFEPPATKAEVRDASLQFVRKICGFTARPKPTNLRSSAGRRNYGIIQSTYSVIGHHGRPRNRKVKSEKPRPGPP